MVSGRVTQAIASGPKAGASMTSSKNLAVQRQTPHIADSIADVVLGSQFSVPRKNRNENRELRTGN
jgi:hypothetical protein